MSILYSENRDKHSAMNGAPLSNTVSMFLVNFVQRSSMLHFNILPQQNVTKVLLKSTHQPKTSK